MVSSLLFHGLSPAVWSGEDFVSLSFDGPFEVGFSHLPLGVTVRLVGGGHCRCSRWVVVGRKCIIVVRDHGLLEHVLVVERLNEGVRLGVLLLLVDERRDLLHVVLVDPPDDELLVLLGVHLVHRLVLGQELGLRVDVLSVAIGLDRVSRRLEARFALKLLVDLKQVGALAKDACGLTKGASWSCPSRLRDHSQVRLIAKVRG